MWGGGENIREEGAFGFDLIRCLRVVYLLLPKKKKLLKRVEKKKKLSGTQQLIYLKIQKMDPIEKKRLLAAGQQSFSFINGLASF